MISENVQVWIINLILKLYQRPAWQLDFVVEKLTSAFDECNILSSFQIVNIYCPEIVDDFCSGKGSNVVSYDNLLLVMG